MKTTIAKCLMALVTFGAVHAFADTAAETVTPEIRWTENSQTVTVTADDVNKSAVPPLGYVLDLTTKKDLCYVGKDFEAINLIYNGLNHHGVEICDSYVVVTNDGTILVGPCQQPHVHDEFYTAQLPVCAQ